MLEPIQAMIQDITGYIPNLLSAGIIGAIFYIFSTVARDLISSLTAGFGVDQIVEKMDLKGITLQPSYLLGTIVFWIIAVTGIAEVANALNLNVLQDTVYNILGIAGNVLLGVAILMLGVYAAKTVRQIAVSSGASKAVGQLAYLAILIFIGAIGLQQMNLGTDIVNMTFAFLLGALALGVAIAIGLGAKDSIGKLVDDVITSFK